MKEINEDACTTERKSNHPQSGGKSFYVCVEGNTHEWGSSTITTEEIALLGEWDVAQGVIEIDKDNNERTLQPGEIVELKPGHGFAKKVCWKRGLNATEERIGLELQMLRNKHPDLLYVADGQWVLIPHYLFGDGWRPSAGSVVFQIPPNGFPGTPPYGIYVQSGLRFNRQQPNNFTEPAPNQPPFEGNWGVFSWAPQDNYWRPGATVQSGSNLINWVYGFASRFKEGL